MDSRPLKQLLFALASVLMASHAGLCAERPNIVFILADDLGVQELGCEGNRFNETPHLDRLAREGMRFTQAYAAAPVCSPTRVALLTGHWPARVGITDYLGPNERDKFFRPDYPTLIKTLNGHGYVTGLIGKWHLTGDYKLGRGAPEKHGWSEIICSERDYIGPGSYFHPWKHLPGVEARVPEEYLTDRLNAEAESFIRRNRERPFFLYLSHYAPHTKLAGKPEMVAKYAAKPGASQKRNNPRLAAMLESIDQGVGRILATLEELKLSERTLVVFTSDNGGESNVTSNAPCRGGKSELYEGGIRVSLIARMPGLVPAGKTSGTPVTTVDFFPTFVALTGAPKPNDHQFDGTNILPLLKGEDAPLERPLYWHYPLAKPHFLGGRSAGAIRGGAWKLIEFYDDQHVELYNLAADPGEERNLASEQREKAEELRKQLLGWRVSVGARGVEPARNAELEPKTIN